jgi:hypothetical protein
MGRAVLLAVSLVLVLGVAACSDDDGDGEASDDSTPAGSDDGEEATPLAADFDPASVGELTVAPPTDDGLGATILGPGGLDLASVGYEQDELFVSGTATSYLSDEPLTEDGEWDVAPDAEADFTTRVVVRRPTDAAAFNGNVVVEWLNVSGGLDADPDWVYSHVELIREGWAWIGVSAQARGIEGGGGPGAILALQPADPERYGELVHPGDDFSYDMFSQVGAAVRTQPDALLGELEPERVLAIGESQSAFRLTTYTNAVAPLTNVYDGYLVHSRSDSAADLNTSASPPQEAPSPTLFRTDLDVPILVFSAETDLIGLEYAKARQDDTDLIRGWEVPGTAHADAYNLGIGDTDDGSGAGDQALFDAMVEPPDSVYGGVISCDAPINSGPHTYVLRSALRALDHWVRTGEAPPEMPRIELTDDLTDVVADDAGNALGGIRTPHVDAPIAVLSGQGQTGEGFCGLFGTTRPFDAATLAEAYPDHEAFAATWGESLDAAVEAGAILEDDATNLRQVAEGSSIGG